MNHIVKRIAILSGVFAAALGVFFFANNRWNSGQDQAVYMDMEAASLPSVTVQMLDRDMNRLLRIPSGDEHHSRRGNSDHSAGGPGTYRAYHGRTGYRNQL